VQQQESAQLRFYAGPNISSHKTIANYIKNNQTKPYKGKYTFALKK
jgi:hypothetical protein